MGGNAKWWRMFRWRLRYTDDWSHFDAHDKRIIATVGETVLIIVCGVSLTGLAAILLTTNWMVHPGCGK